MKIAIKNKSVNGFTLILTDEFVSRVIQYDWNSGQDLCYSLGNMLQTKPSEPFELEHFVLTPSQWTKLGDLVSEWYSLYLPLVIEEFKSECQS